MGEIANLVSFCAHISGLSYTDATSVTYNPPEEGTSRIDVDGELKFPAMNFTNLLKGKEWFGIAGPFSNFLSGFGFRLKELRLGHSEFPVSKDAQ